MPGPLMPERPRQRYLAEASALSPLLEPAAIADSLASSFPRDFRIGGGDGVLISDLLFGRSSFVLLFSTFYFIFKIWIFALFFFFFFFYNPPRIHRPSGGFCVEMCRRGERRE
ncbi:hypothetical protein D8B26_005671 [Coccidioides posadasii str. Silveira]|uniref:uncharacterized protein n=1 Tax=Coccidioides posadasii (strain RMSCC 757 / Silveira) TaxID=443226 RepID=UPI001BED8BB4|nr:hypothetical protein D8B26_005671 [Coccidioides posadasii str. Silveira]